MAQKRCGRNNDMNRTVHKGDSDSDKNLSDIYGVINNDCGSNGGDSGGDSGEIYVDFRLFGRI